MAIKIDFDTHFTPHDAYADMDPKFRAMAPRSYVAADGREATIFPAKTQTMPQFMWDFPTQFRLAKRAKGLSDAAVRAKDLPRTGFDRQVLFAQGSPYGYEIEAELCAEICRSYNNALGRVVKAHPQFIGLAMVPMQHVGLAIEELERAVNELGLHAPLINTNILDRNLDELEFWPFYSKVEELGVPLILHSSHTTITAGAHRYKRYRFGNALQFPAEAALAIGSLICSGVMDAFPKLKVASAEAGAGWVPYLFERLDEVAVEEPHYTHVSIKKLPSQYFDRLWFSFNVKTEYRSLPFIIERIGADSLLISSDYPHGLAGSGPNMLEYFETLETVSPADKDKIAGLNAARLFGLPV